MRIKGSELRRIIKEEISRSVRLSSKKFIMKEAASVSLEDLDRASDAYIKSSVPGGLFGRSIFTEYKSAWQDATTKIKFMARELPNFSDADTRRISDRAIAGIHELGSLGNRHPLSAEIMSIAESDFPSPQKARMIFVTLAGGDISTSEDGAGSHYLGLDNRLGALNKDRVAFDEKIKFAANDLIVPILRLVSTDIVAEVDAVSR